MSIGDKIRKLRNERDITQDELARKLGIPRTSISQIEQGNRKLNSDEVKKLARFFNISTDYLLDMVKEAMVKVIKHKMDRQEKPQLRISVPQKNINKFKEILLYLLNKVGSKPNIGETVIYKLLYFIDFNYYEKYEEQIIGATYQRNKYGPTPIEFKKVIGQMKDDIEKVDSNYFSYPQVKYLPKRPADLKILTAQELEVVNDVLQKLSDMSAAQISEYSHNDIPWLTTPEGEIIDYEKVFYRTPAYSVRDYPDEDYQD